MADENRLKLETIKRYGLGGRKARRFAGKQVRIWSAEHRAYWRSGGAGYTQSVQSAGLYDFEDAHLRTRHCGPEKRIVYELAVPTYTVADLADDELLKRAVANCRPRRGRGKQPRWVGVQDTFALGSTYSHQLCRRFDIDPDEMVAA